MRIEPKVSVIIPVYNGSDYLAQAIDSALAQDYKNTEIIVVNDGSTDDGAGEKIALSYGDRIRYYCKENGGVSTALNYALERAEGEYFSWLSHDDLYYPQKISKQIEFLNRIADEEPELDLNRLAIHTATESIDKDCRVIKTPNYSDVPEKENTLDVIISNVYNYRLSGCSFLLPIACFRNTGGFREDIRTVSDVEYWYRLMFEGYRFFCVREILVRNRSHGRQVGKTKVSLFEKELDALHRDIADRLNVFEGADIRDMERFYLGLKKRGINGAADYTKKNYLRGKTGGFRYSVVIPVKAAGYSLLGKGRTAARDIFRKIKVK